MNRIKAIRTALKVKQYELAAAANISQPYLHDLENGARGAKAETWARLADALGVTVDELRREDNQPCQNVS